MESNEQNLITYLQSQIFHTIQDFFDNNLIFTFYY